MVYPIYHYIIFLLLYIQSLASKVINLDRSHQELLHSKPYPLPLISDTFSVFTSVFSSNKCSKMHWQVHVLLMLLDKYYHTDYLSLTCFLRIAAKLYHESVFLKVPHCYIVVILLRLEEKKLHLEANMKGNKTRIFSLWLLIWSRKIIIIIIAHSMISYRNTIGRIIWCGIYRKNICHIIPFLLPPLFAALPLLRKLLFRVKMSWLINPDLIQGFCSVS